MVRKNPGKNPGTGWQVDILWPDGETEVVKGFITEIDAANWIAEHSKVRQEIRRASQFKRRRTPTNSLNRSTNGHTVPTRP
jgi:hypothetical protein